MNATHFATANELVSNFGSTARQAIELYRANGQRLADFADQRWNEAFKESSPQLSAETRKNATHAKKVFAGYYARGLALSASGAEVAVDTMVQAASAALERAAAWQQARAQ